MNSSGEIPCWLEREYDPDNLADTGTLLHAIIEMWLSRYKDSNDLTYTRLKNIFFPPDKNNRPWLEELAKKSQMTLPSAIKVKEIVKNYKHGFSKIAREIKAYGEVLGGIRHIDCEIRLPVPPVGATSPPFLTIPPQSSDAKIRGICDALLVCKEGLVFFDWKSRVPKEHSEIYRAQVKIYMAMANNDKEFFEVYKLYFEKEWYGSVVGLQNGEPNESDLFSHDRDEDILSLLLSKISQEEQTESDYCKWYCPSLRNDDDPCRQYSFTSAARTFNDADFWNGYYKPGKGAYEHRFESDIEDHWTHTTIKMGQRTIDIRFSSPHPRITRNSKVRMIGYLKRKNCNESHFSVEEVILL